MAKIMKVREQDKFLKNVTRSKTLTWPTISLFKWILRVMGFPRDSAGKEFACNVGDLGSIPRFGRSLGEGKGYPVQYSGLENCMDCIVHVVTKNQTWLSDFHFLRKIKTNHQHKNGLIGLKKQYLFTKGTLVSVRHCSMYLLLTFNWEVYTELSHTNRRLWEWETVWNYLIVNSNEVKGEKKI